LTEKSNYGSTYVIIYPLSKDFKQPVNRTCIA